MLSLRLRSSILSLASLLCLHAQAGPALSEPNWTRTDALQAAEAVDTLAALKPLLALARRGDDAGVMLSLTEIAGDEGWPLPARERVLYEFAVSLADLPVDAVDATVLRYLMDRQPAVLVPHPDHSGVGVPLFNARAAAAGVARQWERRAAHTLAESLYREGGAAWLAAFRAAGPAQRRGFLDALDSIPAQTLRQVAEAAVSALPDDSSLTPLAAQAALLLPDVELLAATLTDGSGPGLPVAIRNAALGLDETERSELLHHAARNAGASTAALILAELGPELLHQPETVVLLFDLLGDRALGAAAALLLSRSSDPAVRKRLADRAARATGLESQRAALASSLAAQDQGRAGR